MLRKIICAGALLSATFATPAIAFDPSIFNVYAIDGIGSASQLYGSDFQGITGSGGDVYFANFSLNLINNPSPGTGVSLYSGGNVTYQGGSISNGGIEASKNVNLSNSSVSGDVKSGGNVNLNGGTVQGNVSAAGTVTKNNATVTGSTNQGQSFVPSVNYGSIASFFKSASTFYKDQSTSSNLNVTNNYGQLVVSNLSSGLNVLNLTGDQYRYYSVTGQGQTGVFNGTNSGTNHTIKILGPSDAYLVLNVDGVAMGTFNSLSFDSGSTVALSNFLINLPNATTVTLNGGTFGSILAPLASVTFPNGLVTGNLIADYLYGGGQVNIGQFTGWGTAVPEPGTYLLMGSSLLLVAYLMHKRRKAASAK